MNTPIAITATTIAIATATLSSITAPLLCLGDVFGPVGEAMEFARKLLAAMSTVRHHCGPLSILGEISRPKAPRVRVGGVSPFGAPSSGVGTRGAETTRIERFCAGGRTRTGGRTRCYHGQNEHQSYEKRHHRVLAPRTFETRCGFRMTSLHAAFADFERILPVLRRGQITPAQPGPSTLVHRSKCGDQIRVGDHFQKHFKKSMISG